jgi:Protein kinase domain
MAQHRFPKLNLDVTSSQKPAKSPLASIHRRDISDDVRAQSQGVPLRPDEPSEMLTSADLRAEAPEIHSHVGSLGDVEDNAGVEERDFGELSDLGEQFGSTSELSSLEASLRNRGTVISFDTKVTLENGVRLGISQPLPRSESWLGPFNGSESEYSDHEAVHHRVYSDTETSRFDSITGRPLDRRKDAPEPYYKTGEMRHPILQSTVDELAKHHHLDDHEKAGLLRHAVTDGESAQGLSPPLNDYLLSPATASPIPFTPDRSNGAWPLTRRSDSTRSGRSYRSEKSSFGSVGRPGRRRSTRSQTSMSPASAFLSQWSSRDEPPPPPEPDTEGQEIGEGSGWIIGRQIGYGGFSVVKEVSTIQNSRRVTRAVKIVRKQVRGKDEYENQRIQDEFEHEVEIWRNLKHKNILPLIEVYVSDFATYCITQLNTGGTLYDLVRSRRKLPHDQRGLPARLAKRYIYQLASAIRYLHEDMHVVHRDIKLENCLVDMSAQNASEVGGNILLCDFGMAGYALEDGRNAGLDSPADTLARNIGPGMTSTSVVGSLQYAPPEVMRAQYNIYSRAVDIWAFGVVMYALFTSELPFNHQFEPRLVMMISKGDWDEVPLLNAPAVQGQPEGQHAVTLVRRCLIDEDLRWHASEILECRWLEGCKEIYEPEVESPIRNGWARGGL